MEILAEGAVSGGKTEFVGNALDRLCQGYGRPRDAFHLALQIKRFRPLPFCGTRRPEDCMLPGRAEEL
jgi:hypothetical protein